MSIDFIRPEVDELRPRISVIGVGGAGGNAVANMMRADVQGVDFIVANTDAQALNASTADRRIQLGLKITQGLGAGSRPEIGRAAAEETLEDIERALDGSHMCFIAAHAGGDEAHVRAFERALDVFDGFISSGASDFRPRASAKALRNLQTKLNTPIGRRGVQRLRVRIRDDEVHALNIGAHHVRDGIPAGATDANYADPRPKFINFRPNEIDAHGQTPFKAR